MEMHKKGGSLRMACQEERVENLLTPVHLAIFPGSALLSISW